MSRIVHARIDESLERRVRDAAEVRGTTLSVEIGRCLQLAHPCQPYVATPEPATVETIGQSFEHDLITAWHDKETRSTIIRTYAGWGLPRTTFKDTWDRVKELGIRG